MNNNENSINPICGECQGCHNKKYENFVSDKGDIYNTFPVNCSLIPVLNKYVPDHTKKKLTLEEQEEAEILLDPVKWARHHLVREDGRPWEARWYQAEMLRCSSNRKVVRAGRRIGKTDTIAVDILHYSFTNSSRRVLLVAPYKSQIEEIFSRLRAFINNNVNLKNSVSKDVSSPYYQLQLHNGTTIRGFTSGTKSGSEAGAVRGQDAHRIYLDEADYLQQGDLNAIQAILLTAPETRLWASSTPTGRRDHFYKWCKSTPTYKEFHYPSMVLPHWEQVEDEIRADIDTELAWTHEILADFGEQKEGVYQHTYIEQAKFDYKYESMKPQLRDWIYSIGVDWNSEVGTEIVVVGYNIREHLFYVVGNYNVPKQDWTQLKGIEKIIELNAYWKPQFIYVDEGAGSTNIELLRKHGHDTIYVKPNDPACYLKDRVKSYNFSSKIEARDPITKKIIKKHAKPYLVENSVRRFEEKTVRFSKHDYQLEKQLRNYIIERVNPSGVPVYGQNEESIGDHKVDAFNLALIGYKLELSSLGKPHNLHAVAFSGQFGEGRNLPNKPVPQPGELVVKYDKEYEQYKRNEKAINNKPQTREGSRGNFGGNVLSPGRGPVATTRPGWDTDTEYKHRKSSRKLGPSNRPKRKNI